MGQRPGRFARAAGGGAARPLDAGGGLYIHTHSVQRGCMGGRCGAPPDGAGVFRGARRGSSPTGRWSCLVPPGGGAVTSHREVELSRPTRRWSCPVPPGGGVATARTSTRLSGAHGGRARVGAGGRAVRKFGEVGARRAPSRQARRGGPRSGQDLYHYPAERSSRRPSPRGAGGRAVRAAPGGFS